MEPREDATRKRQRELESPSPCRINPIPTWPRNTLPSRPWRSQQAETSSRPPLVTSEERIQPFQQQPSPSIMSTLITCCQTIWQLISTSGLQEWLSRSSSLKELLQLLHQYSGQWVTVTILSLTLVYLPTDCRHWLRTILAHVLPSHLSTDTSSYLRLNRDSV